MIIQTFTKKIKEMINKRKYSSLTTGIFDANGNLNLIKKNKNMEAVRWGPF